MLIGFSNRKGGIESTIINYFTSGNWSHCFPVIGEAGSKELVLSADELTVNIVPLEKYFNSQKYDLELYEVPAKKEENAIDQLVESYHHVNYGWFDLLYFVYRYIWQAFGWSWKRKNLIDCGIFCSELTVLALNEIGYEDEFKEYPANTVHPSELRKLVQGIDGVKKIM